MAAKLIGSEMLAALEGAWARIREHHPEVPQVLIIIGSGADGRGTVRKAGHWAALSWRHVGGADVGEVFIAGELLTPEPWPGRAEKPEERVLSTLLHEAAHALADARDIQDTSRQGRYHNTRYRGLAQELGLEVRKVGNIGWSGTDLAPGTAADYRAELRALRKALRGYRQVRLCAGKAKSGGLAKLVCSCEPERIIYGSAKQVERGEIRCGACGGSFWQAS